MYQFLERENVIAVGASALFPSSLIKNKQWQEIRTNLKVFISVIKFMEKLVRSIQEDLVEELRMMAVPALLPVAELRR